MTGVTPADAATAEALRGVEEHRLQALLTGDLAMLDDLFDETLVSSVEALELAHGFRITFPIV